MHNRDHADTTDLPEQDRVRDRFPTYLFETKNHNVSFAGAEGIMDAATWPTYSPQSAQFQHAVSEFLAIIDAKATRPEDECIYDICSKAWRGVFVSEGHNCEEDRHRRMICCHCLHWQVVGSSLESVACQAFQA